MTRFISFSELKNLHFYIDRLECHRQIWKDGSTWEGNVTTPRPMFGLCFICSDIKATYKGGNEPLFTGNGGDVIYIPKGYTYKAEFENGGKSIDIYTVNFTIFDSLGNELILPDSPKLLEGAATPICQEIASSLTDAFLFKQGELKKQALFLNLLDTFLSASDKKVKNYNAIKHGADLFLNEWNKNEKIKKYADICGISESSFYTLFKEWTGESPIDYRNNIRLTAAKSMLENTSLRIAEIAFKVGFDDPYYFTRFFKAHVGMSPREFRNC